MVLHVGTDPLGSHGNGAPLLPRFLEQEIQNLASESDARLREEGLWSLAAREEQKGELGLALQLYSSITETPLRDRAQRRIEALSGRGPIGARAEILLRRLSQDAANPGSLLAMGLASSVFRLTRLAVLANVSSRASGNLLGGLGLRLFANVAGLAVEAPVFTLASRALHGSDAYGNSQPSFTAELASSYLFLGALKLGGGLGSELSRRLGNPSSFASGLAQQTSLLAGIALGHRLESAVGLRPQQDGASLLADSLANLLTFHVSGRLARYAFGPSFAAWEQGLEARSEALIRRPPPGTAGMLNFAEPAWSRVGPGEPRSPWPQAVMMSSNGKGPESGNVPTVRMQAVRTGVEEIQTTDLYMILLNLPRAVMMSAPKIAYDGDAWSETRDAAAIAGRLRTNSSLPRDARLELRLVRQQQRLHFFWEEDRVQYRVFPLGDSSAKEIRPVATKLADTLPAIQAVQPPKASPPNGIYSHHFGKGSGIENVSPNAVAAPAAPPQVAFGDWKSYETDLDRRIEIFYHQRFANNSSVNIREEASALRGRRLARIVNAAFKAESDEDTLPSLHPIETAIQVQAILEHAYGHFDFDTIRTFRDRLSVLGTESFENAITLRNYGLLRKGRPTFLLPAEMALDFPGNYLIPREAEWRDAFLSEWVQGLPYEDLAKRVPELLINPSELARISAPGMSRRLISFLEQTKALQQRHEGEALADLLNPERKYSSETDEERRSQALAFIAALPELSRLLVSGPGHFHRQYLRQLFFTGTVRLQDPYREMLQRMQQLPEQLRALRDNRHFLPGITELRDFARSSSRPIPR